MFSEFLNIKPRLDRGDLARMESSLSGRFTKVARTFGAGLKAVVKSSVLGIGLALLASLLNPLQELEDRIKKLLDRGESLKELADKYGTTTGKLVTLQNIAGVEGLKPDKLESLMDSFVKAIDDAQKEMADNARLKTNKPLSPGAAGVANFVNGGPDMAQNFYNFIQMLSKITDPKLRAQLERNVFGTTLYGGAKSFVNSSPLGKPSTLSNTPSADQITSATTRLNDINRGHLARSIVNQTNDFVQSANKLTPGIVSTMDQREKEQMARDRAELDRYMNLAKAAEAIQKITDIASAAKDILIDIFGAVKQIADWLKQFGPMLQKIPGIKSAASAYGSTIGRFYSAIGLGDSSLMDK